MRIHYQNIPFEHFADDTICHCVSKAQAEHLKEVLTRCLEQCRLKLNGEKTKIVNAPPQPARVRPPDYVYAQSVECDEPCEGRLYARFCESVRVKLPRSTRPMILPCKDTNYFWYDNRLMAKLI